MNLVKKGLLRLFNWEITRDQKVPVFTGIGTFCMVSYVVTNHFHFFEPHYFTLTEFEKSIPFLPWTAWIYISDYVFPFAAGALVRDMKNLTRMSWAFILANILANISFIFFPVFYWRQHYPTNFEEGPLLQLLRILDTEANCFPSFHVASVVLATFVVYRDRPRLTWIFLIWAIAVAISTLTTKQHYLVDVLSGAVLAIFSYLAVEWFGLPRTGSKKA